MLRARSLAGFAIAVMLIPSAGSAQQDATAYGDPGLPINAHPGECYARVYTPPQFRTVSETVLKRAESERIQVTPARYEAAEETVMVKPETERVIQIPAEYRWEDEKVEIKPESEKIEQISATYRTVSEQQLVKPATTVWKTGHGLVEKVDNVTGDIMCLVELPAEYRTITHSEVDQPASTRRVTVPAEYQSVRRQVIARPAEERKEIVPAQYKTIKTRKLVEAAREDRIAIAAEYQTVTHQDKIADGRMEWRSVLCETNASTATVTQLQQALRDAGYKPGAISGHLGAETLSAVRKYQGDNGLPQGGVTMEVLQRLNVQVTPKSPRS